VLYFPPYHNHPPPFFVPPPQKRKRKRKKHVQGMTCLETVPLSLSLSPPTPPRIEMVRFGEGHPRTGEILATIKDLFSRQLPNMPLEYISRIVYEPAHHRSLVALDDGDGGDGGGGGGVFGAICFRTFAAQGFIEIVFCAVTTARQTRGYGRLLMNQLKERMRAEGVLHFLTYADNAAVTFFKKQGFTKAVSLAPALWRGYIKDYDGGTLMECALHPRVPSYLAVPAMLREQQAAVDRLLPARAEAVHPGLGVFASGERRLRPDQIPGVVLPAAWQARASLTPQEERALVAELRDILGRVKRSDHAWPFRDPVPRDVPGYYETIKVSFILLSHSLSLSHSSSSFVLAVVVAAMLARLDFQALNLLFSPFLTPRTQSAWPRSRPSWTAACTPASSCSSRTCGE
jgi:GNAT superfamily N-acetyltransferase